MSQVPAAVRLSRALVVSQPFPSPGHIEAGDDSASALVGGSMLASMVLLGAAVLSCCLSRRPRPAVRPRPLLGRVLLACLPVVTLTACSAESPAATAPAQPARDYLNNAVDWIEEHALAAKGTDWPQRRRAALAVAPDPRTTAEAHAAIRFIVNSLNDVSAFFLEPDATADFTGLGVTALYPEGMIVFVEPGSPATRAGVHEGDVIEAINGEPLRPQGGGPPAGYAGTWFVDTPRIPLTRLAIRHANQDQPITVDVQKTSVRYDGEPLARHLTGRADGAGSIGYIELPWDGGWDDYQTRTQRAIRTVDSTETCGWILDLRRNIGGDFWTYLAGIGPLLGEGDLGGFVFPSGTRERWAYRGGKVLWDGRQRDEAYVADPIYIPKHPTAPVALLTSRATFAAGELLRVAFQGRSGTRTFGEQTGGRPVLQLHTALSDGAHLTLGAAYAFDRTGQTYDRPIAPDQQVDVDWTLFGAPEDPVVAAALDWLHTQPGCES